MKKEVVVQASNVLACAVVVLALGLPAPAGAAEDVSPQTYAAVSMALINNLPDDDLAKRQEECEAPPRDSASEMDVDRMSVVKVPVCKAIADEVKRRGEEDGVGHGGRAHTRGHSHEAGGHGNKLGG